MIKLKIQRGDILRKILAIIIMVVSVFGGVYVYQKIAETNQDGMVKVTFDIDGEIIEKEVRRGNSVEAPIVPEKMGFSFVGWDNPASFDIITKDEIYRAIYKINEYTITFKSNCDQELAPITYEFGEKINEFEVPIKPGYEFVGWYYQGVIFNSSTMPAYNLELEGIWYSTITFEDVEGISFESIKNVPGTKITAPKINEEDAREGQIIVWYKDYLFQNVYTFNRMPENSIKLYGRFEDVVMLEDTFIEKDLDNELDNTIDNYDELFDYLEYMIFNRITEEVTLYLNYSIDNIFSELEDIRISSALDTECKINHKKSGKKLTVRMEFGEEATTKASLTDLYHQLPNTETILMNGRNPEFDDFEIDKLSKGYEVFNSEQLFYVVEQGYKPIFDSILTINSDVVRVYNEAKYILRNIITSDMNAYEKVHAIYDWLIINVTYDKRLKDYVVEGVSDTRKYRGFYLEGVFLDRRAVCDGISKAFVLLCRLEGIECIRVKGVALDGSYSHAWNKVRINDMWYIVDATSGGTIYNEKELVNHNYLFTNEDFYGSKFIATTYTNIMAYGEYDIYQEMFFEYDGYLYDFNITSQEELNILLKWYVTNFDGNTTIDFKIDFLYGSTIKEELLEAVEKAGIKSVIPLKMANDSELENKVLILAGYQK